MTDKDALRQEDATRSDDAVGVEETPEAAAEQGREVPAGMTLSIMSELVGVDVSEIQRTQG